MRPGRPGRRSRGGAAGGRPSPQAAPASASPGDAGRSRVRPWRGSVTGRRVAVRLRWRPHRGMPMRIAQLAPTFERVPPRTYGGTELVVGLITEELVARGHDVTLFASGDSRTRARLRSVTPEPVRYGATTRRRPDPRRVPPARERPGRVPRRRRRGVRPRPQPRRGRGDGPRIDVRHARHLDDAQPVQPRGRSRSGTPTRGSTTRSRPRAPGRSRSAARCRRSSTGSTSTPSARTSVPACGGRATTRAISCSSAGSARRRAPTGRSRRPCGPGGGSSSPARSIRTT